MRPAHTPSSVKGSISKCVVSLQDSKTKKTDESNANTEEPSRGSQLSRVSLLGDHVFVKGDLTVIFLIDIQIFHQALMQEVFKVSADEKVKKRSRSHHNNKTSPAQLQSHL